MSAASGFPDGRGGIAWIGDLDGDGVHAEAIAGDLTLNSQAGGAHAIQVQLSSETTILTAWADGVGGIPIGTLASGDRFGAAVESLGTGGSPAVPVVAVGASGDDTGGTDAGAVYICSVKSPSGELSTITKLANGLNGVPVDGFSSGAGCGSSLAFLGEDLGGQKLLAISCRYTNTGGVANTGSVAIVTLDGAGAAASFVMIGNGQGGMPVDTLADADQLGTGTALLRNDGSELSIAVGAYGDDTGYPDAGAVHLITLDTTTHACTAVIKLGEGIGGLPNGTLADSDNFGFQVRPVGTRNGNPLLAVSSPGDDSGGELNIGAVYLLEIGASNNVVAMAKLGNNGLNGLPVGEIKPRIAGIGFTMGVLPLPDGSVAQAGIIHRYFNQSVIMRIDEPFLPPPQPVQHAEFRTVSSVFGDGGQMLALPADTTTNWLPQYLLANDTVLTCDGAMSCVSPPSGQRGPFSVTRVDGRSLTALIEVEYLTTSFQTAHTWIDPQQAGASPVPLGADDRVGSAISRIGDANADGCGGDSALGAVGLDSIYVITEVCTAGGGAGELALTVTAADLGLASGSQLGASVAWVRTTNTAAGRRTLLLAGMPGVEQVVLFAVDWVAAGGTLSATALKVISGPKTTSFGAAVAAYVSRKDSSLVLLVGAPAANSDAGEVSILQLPAAFGPDTIPTSGSTISTPLAAGDAFGSSLAVIEEESGVVIGDWHVLVGAPGTDAGGIDAGAVYSVSISATTQEVSLVARTVANEVRSFETGMPFPSPGSNLGASVSWAGDLDGDGVSQEILVGMPGTESVVVAWVKAGFGLLGGPIAPASWVTLGTNSSATAGISIPTGFASAIAAAGDRDGDGLATDVLVGAPDGTGAVLHFTLSNTGGAGSSPPWAPQLPDAVSATPSQGLRHDEVTTVTISGVGLYKWDPLFGEASWRRDPPRVEVSGPQPAECLDISVTTDGAQLTCTLRATMEPTRSLQVIVGGQPVGAPLGVHFEPFEALVADGNATAGLFTGVGLLPSNLFSQPELVAAGVKLLIGDHYECPASALQQSLDGSWITCSSMPIFVSGPHLVRLLLPGGIESNSTLELSGEAVTVTGISPVDTFYDRESVQSFTVFGTGFHSTGPLSLFIGGNACTEVSRSATQLDCLAVQANFSSRDVIVEVVSVATSTGGEDLLNFLAPAEPGIAWIGGQGVVLEEDPTSALHSQTVAFRLASQPTAMLTITLSDVASPAQVAMTPSTITVEPSGWAELHSVTLTAVADAQETEVVTTTQVQLVLSSTDPLFHNLSPDDNQVEVSIVNDLQGADLTPAPLLASARAAEDAVAIVVTLATAGSRPGYVSGGVAFDCLAAGLFDRVSEQLLTGLPEPRVTTLPCEWVTAADLRVRVDDPNRIVGRNVTLRGGGAGIRAAGHTLSVFTTSGTVSVQARLPVPQLTSAKFDPVTASVLVSFSSATSGLLADTGASSGDCSLVFDNTNLGAGSRCSFVTATQLRASLGGGATIQPLRPSEDSSGCQTAAALVLVAGAVRATATSVASASGCINVAVSTLASPPEAVLVAPAAISPCDGLVLDASESTGGAGRELSFEWSVVAHNPVGAASVANISAVLAALGSSPRVRLGSDQLPALSVLEFSVTVRNWLSDAAGVASHALTVSATPHPSVAVAGPAVRTVNRAGAVIRLEALGSPPACGEDAASFDLSYSWRVVSVVMTPGAAEGYSVAELGDDELVIGHESGGGRILYVDPSRLQVGGRYSFVATVASPSGAANESAPVVVSVAASPLHVAIAGPAERQSNGEEPLVLDSRASFDPDFDASNSYMAAGTYPPLNPYWSCEEVAPDGSVLGGCSTTSGATLIGTSTAVWGLPSGTLPTGLYKFTSRWSRGSGASAPLPLTTRSASASTIVKVVTGATVGVTARASGLSASGEVQTGVRVMLMAGSTSAGVSFAWELLGQPAALRQRVFSSSPAAPSVTLRRGVLPAGGTFTFRVTASSSDSTGSATASVVVKTNAGPTAGYLQVSPRLGTVLATRFTLTAPAWTDADLPLSYQFGYFQATPSQVAAGEATFQALAGGAAESSPVATVLLPVGRAAGQTVTMAVRVRDAKGIVTESILDGDGVAVVVQVQPAAATTAAELLTAAQSAWAEAGAFSPYDGDAQTVSAVASSLQSTHLCSQVACGLGEECVSGQCFEVSTATAGASPTMATCPGSSSAVAELANGVLAPVVQCSGHGSCKRAPRRCSTEAAGTCLAFCECSAGWAGTDCSLSASEAQATTELFSAMVERQESSLTWLDASGASVDSRALALSAAASGPLDEAAGRRVAAVASSLANASVALSDSAALALLNSLDASSRQFNVAMLRNRSAGVDSAVATSDGVVQAASAVLSGLLEASVAGEEAVSLAFDGGLVQAQRVAGGSASALLELGASGAQVSLPGEALGGDDDLQLQATAWEVSPFTWQDDQNETALEEEAGVAAAQFTVVDVLTASGSAMSVSGLVEPVVLASAVGASADASALECTARSSGDGDWSPTGLVAVALEGRGESGSALLVCASTHLTAFTARLRDSQPAVNEVDPLRDAGSLKLLLEPENVVVAIVLLGLGTAFLLAWLVSVFITCRQRAELDELRKAHFLQYGAIRPGTRDAQYLHIKRKYPDWENPDLQYLREARKSGVAFLIIRYLWSEFWHAVRSRHTWASIFSPPLDEQLAVSRGQRVGILAGACLCSMAVSAAFFGNNPSSILGYFLVSIYGSLAMAPVYYLFPFLFWKANSFTSRTHGIAAQLKQQRKALTRRQRRQLLREVKLARQQRSLMLQARLRRADEWIAANIVSQPGGVERGDQIVSRHFPPEEARAKPAPAGGVKPAAAVLHQPVLEAHSHKKRQAAISARSNLSSRRSGIDVLPAAATSAATTPKAGDQPLKDINGLEFFLDTPSYAGRRHSTAVAPKRKEMVLQFPTGEFGSSGSVDGDLPAAASPAPSLPHRRASQPITRGDLQDLQLAGEIDRALAGLQPEAASQPGSIASLGRSRVSLQGGSAAGQPQPLLHSRSTRLVGPALDGRGSDFGVAVRERWGLYKRTQEMSSNRGLVVLAILNVAVLWAGVMGVLLALYVMVAQDYQPDKRGRMAWWTVALVGGGGVGLAATGLLGLASAQKKLPWRSALSFAIGAATQAAGGVVMWWFDLPMGREASVMVLMLQIAPTLLAMGIYYLMLHIQLRLVSAVHYVAHVPELVTARTARERRLVARVQAAYRGHVVRSEMVRQNELLAWVSMRCLRGALVALTYVALGMVIGMALYLNLLYGVRFTPEQQRAWLLSAISAFLFSILVTEPLAWLGFVLMGFLWKLQSSTAREVVLASLAARIAGAAAGGDDAAVSRAVTRAKQLHVADLIVPPDRHVTGIQTARGGFDGVM